MNVINYLEKGGVVPGPLVMTYIGTCDDLVPQEEHPSLHIGQRIEQKLKVKALN